MGDNRTANNSNAKGIASSCGNRRHSPTNQLQEPLVEVKKKKKKATRRREKRRGG
jgi:hypothetical protein